MKIMRHLLITVLLATLLVPGLAAAEGGSGPVNVSLFAPIQLLDETQSVDAFRFSLIYGVNHDLTGLDISLVGVNKGDVQGIQFTGIAMVEGDFTGAQIGLVNVTKGNMQGFQHAFVNTCSNGSSGFQWGLVNLADDFSGFQLGFVNITENMRSGLQIGLLNIIKNKEKFPILPLVNWRF